MLDCYNFESYITVWKIGNELRSFNTYCENCNHTIVLNLCYCYSYGDVYLSLDDFCKMCVFCINVPYQLVKSVDIHHQKIDKLSD